MTFGLPQALLLIAPVALVLWWLGLPRGLAGVLRAVVAALLVLALARPIVDAPGGGRDVVLVIDRSRSMPAESDTRALELVQRLETKQGTRDRIAVVTFGREARIERPPIGGERFGQFQRAVDGDGSDLAAALEAADGLASDQRQARVLVLSDGLATGADPRPAARRLGERGIPIDFRSLQRDDQRGDAAVASLDVPAQVSEGEPFQFGATLQSDRARDVGYVLRRGGAVLARGRTSLRPGPNRLMFRDRLDQPGLAEYVLELEGHADAVSENDRARALVRVAGKPRVRVVRSDGRRSALVASLEAAGFDVTLTPAAPRTLEELDGLGALVLENVPASALGEQGLRVVTSWVRDAGGGLLMTGGRRAFGEGGYHRSALEEVLPVTMELREEQRRASIALGISMDRSGSMMATTPEGVTKMQLAAEGAVAALTLLSPGDEAAVWVVDTRPHVVFPLTKVEDGLSLDLVAAVRSEGGGIYVGEALRAAAAELLGSRKATRHLILFSDVSDSEEPDDYRETLARLRAKEITVSVIGLGTATDPDADLLREIADLGGGRLYFAETGTELPRLFSEETIVLARSAFVDGEIPLAPAPDLALLGGLDAALPVLGGYNLTYARPDASVALRTTDENTAPIVAFRQAGLGRTAVFLGEADGEFSGGLKRWNGHRELFSRLVRRVMHAGDDPRVLAKARREGHELHVTVEVDDSAAEALSDPSVTMLSADGSATPTAVSLRREDAHVLGARLPIGSTGSLFPIVQVGGRVLRVAPVTLPYAPEFEPRSAGEGRALLEELALLTGGQERVSVDAIYTAAGAAAGRRSIAPWLAALALVLLLAEVAVRRWLPGWTPRRRPAASETVSATTRRRPVPVTAAAPHAEPPPAAGEPQAPEKTPESAMQEALDRVRERKRRG